MISKRTCDCRGLPLFDPWHHLAVWHWDHGEYKYSTRVALLPCPCFIKLTILFISFYFSLWGIELGPHICKASSLSSSYSFRLLFHLRISHSGWQWTHSIIWAWEPPAATSPTLGFLACTAWPSHTLTCLREGNGGRGSKWYLLIPQSLERGS